MKRRSLLSTMFIALFFTFNANAGHLKDNLLISAKMDGAQETPAVSTNALGIASFMLNATRDTISVNISATGLSGAITGIHVHEGQPGSNGGVVIDLTPFVSGNRVTGKLTGNDASAASISKFLSGRFYVNIHTIANPGGEIRGQLNMETDWSFSVNMDGSQEVPPVSTTAYGVGVFNLSKDLSKIKYNVVVQSLSGAITGAHLHIGAAGVAGGVNVDVSSNVSGNIISGTIATPSMALIDNLLASLVYLNVHTVANPNGEIRGQLLTNSRYLYFDASIDGNQEVPAVTTTAKGVATIKFNSTLDTLWYDVSTNGLSGNITGAHFHNASIGNNGGVELDLSPDINGNRITGKITGGMLTNALISKFLKGDMYINIHTTLNPNGEIRGQVYRLAREGYTFSLDGNQEIPAVATAASGSGIVSINREQDNAHYMFVASGLTSGGAHFHKAVAGESGGVIYDLSTAFVNNGAFGYWRNSDATPFTLSNSVQFRNDSVYVNIHTTANPNGEIRGQVLRGFRLHSVITSVVENFASNPAFIEIYPNPATDYLNVTFNSALGNWDQVTITDLFGRPFSAENLSAANSEKRTVNISQLANGFYFVKVQSGDQQFVRKFIKK